MAECHLCTDASEYGIGAYLYQLIGRKEVPIQFLSKKLTDTQRRWSVQEKEAFAINYISLIVYNDSMNNLFLINQTNTSMLKTVTTVTTVTWRMTYSS